MEKFVAVYIYAQGFDNSPFSRNLVDVKFFKTEEEATGFEKDSDFIYVIDTEAHFE